MTNAPSEWRSVLHFILPHPTRAEIAVQHGGPVLLIPSIELPELIWMPDIGPILPIITAVLRRRVTALFAPYYVIHRQPEKWVEAVYVLENLDTDHTLPAGMRWIGRDQIANIADQNHRAAVEAVIGDLEGEPTTTLRPAWSCRGWFREAEAWILIQLEQANYHVKSAVELVRTWGISCVLRVYTDHGLVYFKVASSLPLFSHEPMLMQALSREHADLIPAPLAIDVKRRYMLLPDLGPSLRTSNNNNTIYEATMLALAQIQISYIGRTDDLAAIGCLDRRLKHLITQIDPLFADDENLGPLTDEEKKSLRAYIPRLKDLIDQLGKQPIPPTLIHGDLNVGNVAIGDGQPHFFDWTDGGISHPFFDLITLLDEMIPSENGQVLETRLLNVYFEQWTQIAPLAQLHEIWRIAEPLASLHQAVSYQYIARTLEGTSKQEITGGTAYFLRKLLNNLSVGSETK
jgi:hypothetical protein